MTKANQLLNEASGNRTEVKYLILCELLVIAAGIAIALCI